MMGAVHDRDISACHKPARQNSDHRRMSAVIAPIFVTWTQRWETEQYIEHYLRMRGLAGRQDARAQVRAALHCYPGKAPYTKSDLDFYLDANVKRDR
jgi:hypothetical protein